MQSAKRIIGTSGKAGLATGKHLGARYLGQELFDIVGGEDSEGADKDLSEAINRGSGAFADGIGGLLLDQFTQQKTTRNAFQKELLDKAAWIFAGSETKAPIYVLTDELDRCRPAYAVELLEQIKQFFSVDNFVLLLGSDTTQPAHAVRGLYGAEFDGTRYLKRFVDRTYRFQEADKTQFIAQAFEKPGLLKVTSHFRAGGLHQGPDPGSSV